MHTRTHRVAEMYAYTLSPMPSRTLQCTDVFNCAYRAI